MGKKYSFTFNDILNNLIGKDVILANVVLDCSCEEANWLPSIIPPRSKGGFTASLRPSVKGKIETSIKVYLTDAKGIKPMAIQRIQLTYNAQ